MFKMIAILGLVTGGAGYALYTQTDLFKKCESHKSCCAVKATTTVPPCCAKAEACCESVEACCPADEAVSARVAAGAELVSARVAGKPAACCASLPACCADAKATTPVAAKPVLCCANPCADCILAACKECASCAVCCGLNAKAAVAGATAIAIGAKQ